MHFAAGLLAAVLVGSCAVWGLLALWFQAPGGRARRALALLLWSGFSVSMLYAAWHGWILAASVIFAGGFSGVLAWWTRVLPSNDRIWSDDVARMSSGAVSGNQVTLHNVRNFDWRSERDYTQRWETRTYDLDRLDAVDMIMSYWRGRAIAHMLVSFGFDGGDHVVFSVEIRRERHESFSEIGGFFKEFELSIIAADERDVIRLRTNVRGEDDYLYRLNLRPAAIRSLFLAYVEEANSLTKDARFYNTVTVNCTTLVYHMMKRIVGHLPLDIRLLFSGYLPGYVYRVGGLDPRFSLSELRERGRITERARGAAHSDSFSELIRRGVPTPAHVGDDYPEDQHRQHIQGK